MSAPSNASRATDFASFCSDLLPTWASDKPIAADSQATTARQTAKLALYRAALAEGKGTVLVIVPSHEQKTVQGYIEAMVESSPMLRGLDACIEVCTPERAPLVKDPAHVIALLPEQRVRIEDIDLRDMARSICDVARQGPAATAAMEGLLGVPGFFAESGRRAKELAPAPWYRRREATPSSLPASLHPRSLALGVPMYAVDGRDYFSPEWEEANALRRMMGGGRRTPMVHRRRPGGDQ